MDKYIAEFKKAWQEIIAFYKTEIFGLRSGRVSPALVENIQAESYGSKMPIQHLATITSDSAHSIVIQPWDKANIAPVEKAILDAGIGVNPSNDGNIIRLNFPPLTEEKRQQLTKLLSQKTEENKIKFRQLRDEIKKKFTAEMEKGADEDMKFKFSELLQKEVDAFNGEIEALKDKKEKEILSV